MNDVIRLSLDEAIRILTMETDSANRDTFGIVIRAKTAIIGQAWTMGARVTEENFRQKRFDRLPELIALIKEEEKKLTL